MQSVRSYNTKGECYRTDGVVFSVAGRVRGRAVEAPEDERLGVNARAELALAEAAMQTRLREAAMAEGVTLVAPETVFLCADTGLSSDVLLEPQVVFGPGVIVHEGATIRSFRHLEVCEIHADTVIGPNARIRPGSSIGAGSRVGNFAAIKATTMGTGAKGDHLT